MNEQLKFVGVWNDVGDARQLSCEMTIVGRTVQLRLGDDREISFSKSLVGISPATITGQRILRFRDAGQLELAATDSLDIHFPIQSSSGMARLSQLDTFRWVSVIGAILLPFVLWFGFRVGSPILSSAIAATMPQTMSEHLSKGVITANQKAGALRPSRLDAVRQAEIRYELNKLLEGNAIQRRIKILFFNSPRLGAQAFALPNGMIAVTDQLVRATSSDAEILAVLAHEVGHVAKRHSLRRALSNSGLAGMVALVAGSTAAQVVNSSVIGQYTSSNYSREMELEADDYAFELLENSKISPIVFANALMSIRNVETKHSGGGSFEIQIRNSSRIATTIPARVTVDGVSVRIDQTGEETFAVTHPGRTIDVNLRRGEKIFISGPVGITITRSGKDAPRRVSKRYNPYLSSHPQTQVRVLRAQKAALEFDHSTK